jgi:hypothetical protein
MKRLYLSLTLVAVFGCSPQSGQNSSAVALPTGAEAVSFSGKPLFVRKPDTSVVRRSDSLLSILKSKPALSEDDYVEGGRLLVTQKESVRQSNAPLTNVDASWIQVGFKGQPTMLSLAGKFAWRKDPDGKGICLRDATQGGSV